MDEELYHYGVKGMKWGIRRTPAQLGHTTGMKKKKSSSSVLDKVKNAVSGKKKTSSKSDTATEPKKPTKKKKLSEMNDQELRQTIERMRLEQEYARLNPQKVSVGRKFLEKAVNEVIAPSLTNAARNYVSGSLNKVVSNALKDVEKADPDTILRKQVERMNLRKQAQELEDYFRTHDMQEQVKDFRLQRQQADLYDYLAKRSNNIAGYLPSPEDDRRSR